MRRINKNYEIVNQTVADWKTGTQQHVENAIQETAHMLLKSIYPYFNDSNGSICILQGCVNTGSGSNYIISAGVISYKDANFDEIELFYVNASTFTVTGGNTAVAVISTASYAGNVNQGDIADPTGMSDGNTPSIHDIRTINIINGSAASSNYIGAFSAFKPIKNNNKFYISDDTNIAVASGTGYNSFATLTSSTPTAFTFTTPNDGITRNWRIDFKSWYQQNVAVSTTTLAKLQLFDGTNVLDYTNVLGAAQPTNAQIQGTCNLMYYGSIAPNTTIIVQAQYGGGGANGVDFANNKLFAEELK